MGEHAHAAVFRLDRVLANPVRATADLESAELVEVRTGDAPVLVLRVPAVAPDSPGLAALFLAESGVDRLKVSM